MNISSVPDVGQADASSPSSILVAQKGLSQQKQDGQSALKLIAVAAAPPPPREGHTLSVYA